MSVGEVPADIEKMSPADRRSNRTAAALLREMADLLEQQNASPFRSGAYRRAARTIEDEGRDVLTMARDGGIQVLDALPHVGPSIAAALVEIARTGRLSRLERLRGTLDPVEVFATIPGLGPELAATIHETLHIDALEELELAAHDGRLEQVPGIGPRRAEAVREVLASRLARRRPRRASRERLPSVATLLAADRDYRKAAREDTLRRIAPRRFNPERRAWLPVMHTDRDGWHLTLLFSNTARAHELGRTGDWVVVYFDDDDHHEGQCTVVTETTGPRRGERVVRGREGECP